MGIAASQKAMKSLKIVRLIFQVFTLWGLRQVDLECEAEEDLSVEEPDICKHHAKMIYPRICAEVPGWWGVGQQAPHP